METFTLEHFPKPMRSVSIALFDHVENAPDIRASLVRAATMAGPEGDAARRDIDFGFVEGSVLASKQHLLTAITATLLASLPSTPTASTEPVPKTRSHNLHSEILLQLSPNNNITDSIRRHGVSDATRRLAVVKISDGSADEADIFAAMQRIVKGELVSLELLDDSSADWARIDKIYKLSEMNKLRMDNLRQRKIAAVIDAVAIKSVT